MRTTVWILMTIAGLTSTGPAAACANDAEPLEAGFVALFDGKSLKGWEGNEQVFRVQDGGIVGGSMQSKVARNEFLCTQRKFGDFELRLQAKLIGRGENAGVQFRTERIPNHHEVSGYQCDMGTMQGRTIWGSLYDESRRKKFLAEGDAAAIQKAFRPNDWNTLVIRCEGDRIRIWVNDVPSVDYREQDAGIARTGVIGLQIHGGEPAEAWYRNIRIRELPPAKETK